MGAYNWIELEATCPGCGPGAPVRAQSHVASSFGGTDVQRFHNHDYRLGDRMRWWPADHPDYVNWWHELDVVPVSGSPDVRECCYSSCGRCGTELFAVIRFSDLVPTAVEAVGREEDWPSGFLK